MSLTDRMLLDRRYELEEQIGAGGFSEVWRATDRVLRRPVAVKMLQPGYAQDTQARERFRAEARHAGSLAHENIARIYDYGEPGPRHPPFVVMELVAGPSLAQVLAGGPLDPARSMRIVGQAATGLHAAHAAGLVHRDIKPGNLLLAPGDVVKITDFGIAHAVGSTPVTSTGMVMGTPGYIAPERVSGAQAGPASDLYGLGIVAYECLTGSQPFRGGALDVAIAHRDRPLPPLPVSVPAEVAAFVMTLTAKDPAWRPASAGEVADQAGRLRDDLLPQGDSAHLVPSPPPTAEDYVLIRPRRRRRPLAIAVLTLVALTCLVLISVTGFASGSHPAGSPSHPASHPPSHAASRPAPAATASPSASTSPSAGPSTSPSASPSGRPDASTSSASTVTDTTTAPPGQRHHKKGHGNGNGNSQ